MEKTWAEVRIRWSERFQHFYHGGSGRGDSSAPSNSLWQDTWFKIDCLFVFMSMTLQKRGDLGLIHTYLGIFFFLKKHIFLASSARKKNPSTQRQYFKINSSTSNCKCRRCKAHAEARGGARGSTTAQSTGGWGGHNVRKTKVNTRKCL